MAFQARLRPVPSEKASVTRTNSMDRSSDVPHILRITVERPM